MAQSEAPQDVEESTAAPALEETASPPVLPPPPFPVDGERKPVTVLSCTLIMPLVEPCEPERRYVVLQRFFALTQQEVQRYEGIIDHFGEDGFLAFFGIPVAHEDHAQRAVLAALSLQRTWRQHSVALEDTAGEAYAIRMGVHIGNVLIGHLGDDRCLLVMTVGNTSHLANRLLHLAEPDTIFAQ